MRSPPASRPPKRVLPGFGLSLGYTMLYLSVIVLIPLSAIVLKSSTLGWGLFWQTVTSRRAVRAYEVSFGASLAAAAINAAFGLLVAWVLARYKFFGRRLIDALIDLPFALPTAVAGIALSTLYSETGWIGRHLVPLGVRVRDTPLGVTVALTFVGLPFVVRMVEPVLRDLSTDVEEAAASLGATRGQTVRRVILPEVWPALLGGFALAFARGVGEFGSVIFMLRKLPGSPEIAPQLIIEQESQDNYAEATAIAVVMLAASFLVLLGLNLLQRATGRKAVVA